MFLILHFPLFPSAFPVFNYSFNKFTIRFLLRSSSLYAHALIGSGCGGSVFNTRGTVTSPGYPGNVSRTTDCRWELAVPIGMIIKIEFPGKKRFDS